MKKTALLIAALATAAAASAQIEVTPTGRILVGEHQALECNKTVSLDNCAVEEGGEMSVEAESTKLGAGFKVEKGGTLKIQKRK